MAAMNASIGVLPAPAGYFAFQAIAPGAIVYDYRMGDYDPSLVPAPVPTLVPVPVPGPVPMTRPQPGPAVPPANKGVPEEPWFGEAFVEKVKVTTGLSGAALALYLLVSELSRLYPPRNLVPIL